MKLCFFLLLIFCMGVLSCNTQQQGKNNYDELISLYDSLTLEARFSECGEWGGHREEILISNWKRDSSTLIHTIYPYKCDSLDYYYGNDSLAPASIRQISLLDSSAKEAVIQYIQQLIVSKSKERFPGHAGNIFSVQNSTKTLKIKVHDLSEEPVKSYKQLISALFGDSLISQRQMFLDLQP